MISAASISSRHPSRSAAAAALAIVLAIELGSAAASAAQGEVKEFYIKTVHTDGKASTVGGGAHAPEAFPDRQMPAGGGLVLSGPSNDGKWKMRAFGFVPSQVTVQQGDRVRLNFIGVQGTHHTIHVEGEGVDEKFELLRGHMNVVEFLPAMPGVVEIECYDHQPSMTGQVLVLRKR